MNAPARPRAQRRRGSAARQLSDEVAARLRTDIMTGTLRPGDVHPARRDGRCAGVSITPGA